MGESPVRRDPDIVTNEIERPGVRRLVRDPEVGGERRATVGRLSIEHVYETVSGVQPPVVEDYAKQSVRHSHPGKKWSWVVLSSFTVMGSLQVAPPSRLRLDRMSAYPF